MDSSNPRFGILASLVRFFVMWNWKKARGIAAASDAMWTKDARSKEMAYDMGIDDLVTRTKNVRGGLAKIGVEAEKRRETLSDLNKREDERIKQRDGALNLIEQAKDPADVNKWTDYAARLDEEILKIEQEQKVEEEALKAIEAQVQELEGIYLDLQRKVKELREEKGTAVARAEADEALLAIQDEIAGLKTTFENGPLDAVRKHNRELSAKAKVAIKVGQSNTDRIDRDLAADADKAASRGRVQQMLAERAAKRGVATGETPAAPAAERPNIGG